MARSAMAGSKRESTSLVPIASWRKDHRASDATSIHKSTKRSTKIKPNPKAKRTTKRKSEPVDDSDEDELSALHESEVHTSVGDLEQQAKYTKTSDQYTMTIKLSSKVPFSTKAMVLKGGLLGGTQVISIHTTCRAANQLHFLEMPPEIRNMIYRYALGTNNKWYIGYRGNGSQGLPFRVSKMFVGPSPAVQVLMTCKQINQEAAPVLYGGNNFMFKALSTLDSFLEFIGRQIPHLRNVEVEQWSGTAHKRPFEMLASAPHLTSFRLSLDNFRGRYGLLSGRYLHPERVIRAMKPFLKALQTIHADFDSLCTVLDFAVADFRRLCGSTQHNVWQSNTCADCARRRTEIIESFKEEARRGLGILPADKKTVKTETAKVELIKTEEYSAEEDSMDE